MDRSPEPRVGDSLRPHQRLLIWLCDHGHKAAPEQDAWGPRGLTRREMVPVPLRSLSGVAKSGAGGASWSLRSWVGHGLLVDYSSRKARTSGIGSLRLHSTSTEAAVMDSVVLRCSPGPSIGMRPAERSALRPRTEQFAGSIARTLTC